MTEPYTIRIFVPGGDPGGVKIVDRLNWTGTGVAFPRSAWPELSRRSEFDRPGVYVLIGSEEGAADDLPTIYVGQGDVIRGRIDSHFTKKDFWDWGYVFVSTNNALNRAHITWLEYGLLDRATKAQRCRLDNEILPKQPALSESERADTNGFLSEMLRILPLLGVHVFEKPAPVATPGADGRSSAPLQPSADDRDTVIVPAQKDGFERVFLGEHAWHAIRIGGGMLKKIRYIAAYQTDPVSAITHYAPVQRIEPYGDEGKYRLVFAEPAKPITHIPFADAPPASMMGPRYTNLGKLLQATKVADLLNHPPNQKEE
jgi:hypothetical protein